MSSTEPVSFKDLPVRFKHLSLPLLAAATYAGIRYLLLFPCVRQDDMTPMINSLAHDAEAASPAQNLAAKADHIGHRCSLPIYAHVESRRTVIVSMGLW